MRKPLPDNSRPSTSQHRDSGTSDPTWWSAWAGMLGGLLWVLFPLGELPAAHLVLTPEGYLATYALGFLWAQLLLLMGLRGLHAIHRGGYGWLGTVGFYVSLIALVLTLVGGAFAMTNITFTGAGSTVAYLILITGFLPLGWGSVLLGLTITMVMRDLLSHLTGVLLAIGVPLGLLVSFVAGTTWDFYFWAGLTMPYGLAWLLLGYALLPGRGASVKSPLSFAKYMRKVARHNTKR